MLAELPFTVQRFSHVQPTYKLLLWLIPVGPTIWL